MSLEHYGIVTIGHLICTSVDDYLAVWGTLFKILMKKVSTFAQPKLPKLRTTSASKVPRPNRGPLRKYSTSVWAALHHPAPLF